MWGILEKGDLKDITHNCDPRLINNVSKMQMNIKLRRHTNDKKLEEEVGKR